MKLLIKEEISFDPKRGDLLITKSGARLIIFDAEEEKYALLNLETSTITTDWYFSLDSLLDGYDVSKRIPAENLVLEAK